jgi:MFS family permease
VGLLTSGLLLEVWSWRSVFGLNVALAVVALAGTLRVVPESVHPDAVGRDLTGTVLSVAGLAALVFSVIEAPTQGWSARRTLVGLDLGLLFIAAFIAWNCSVNPPCWIHACSSTASSRPAHFR